jgi:D-amino-acid dehydrogenase
MRVIILGGGIIGLSSAWYLAEAGWQVTVLEKGDLTDNCSFGNMGYLSPSHFVPIAAPGIVEQGILWMFDQKSPFYIRPSAQIGRASCRERVYSKV